MRHDRPEVSRPTIKISVNVKCFYSAVASLLLTDPIQWCYKDLFFFTTYSEIKRVHVDFKQSNFFLFICLGGEQFARICLPS